MANRCHLVVVPESDEERLLLHEFYQHAEQRVRVGGALFDQGIGVGSMSFVTSWDEREWRRTVRMAYSRKDASE